MSRLQSARLCPTTVQAGTMSSFMNRQAVRRACQVCHVFRDAWASGTVPKVSLTTISLSRKCLPSSRRRLSVCRLSTFRCLETNTNELLDPDSQLNRRIDLLLASSSWSLEDWLCAQEVLNTKGVPLRQLLDLVRYSQRQASASSLVDAPVRLSLHNVIGLWHSQVYVQPKGGYVEPEDPTMLNLSSRDWVDLTNESPYIFEPLSLSSLSKLVHAALKSDDMDLAVSLMDEMVSQMALSYRHKTTSNNTSSASYSWSPSPVVQVSLHNILLASASGSLENVVSLFAKYQPYLNRSGYNAVLSALARHGQGEQAEQLLDEMCKGYCVDWTGETLSPDIRSFNLVLSAWSQSQGPSGAERAHAILLRLYDPFDWGALGITPDAVSWNTVLKAWARSSRVDAVASAVHVLQEMREYGRAGMDEARPTSVAYGTVLDAMAKKGQAEVAERLWLEMYHGWETDPEWGVAPTWMTAAPVLQAWSRSNRPDRTLRAEQWLRRVKNLIPEEPDPAVYHILLSCYASVSTVESAQQVEALLNSIPDPDFVSYSIVMQHFARIPEKVKRAHELFKAVQERYRSGHVSFRPDPKSLDSILQSFCKADCEIATKLLHDIVDDAISGRVTAPSLKTFGTFMNALKTSSNPSSPLLAMDILKLLNNCHRSGVVSQGPDHLIYQSLIAMWTRSGLQIKDSSRTALSILREFRSKALEGEMDQGPTTLDYNMVIRSLSRDYHPVKAHELLEEMVSSHWTKQCRPDAATFHAVQWGWAKIGNADALKHMEMVFRHMDELGFIHDTVSKNNVIHCLTRMGDPERAEAVLKLMNASRDKRTSPSPVSYESVMMGWLKLPNLDRAYDVLMAFDHECDRGVFVPLQRLYLTMQQALEEAGDYARAESVIAMWTRFHNNPHRNRAS